METSLQRPSAVVLIIGSIFFLIAAFSPISRIFGEPSAVRKLEIILDAPGAWMVAQVFFAAGALVAAIGVGMMGYTFRETSYGRFVYLSAAILLAGALCWSWHVYARAVDPASFVERALSVWPFVFYTLLSQAGFAILGFALLRSGLPHWVGWMLIGSMAFFFVLTVIFRDMPPFVYYVVTLVVGIVLYRAGSLVTT